MKIQQIAGEVVKLIHEGKNKQPGHAICPAEQLICHR